MLKGIKTLAIGYFFILTSFFYSQTNLVLNPSFETYTACPNGADIYKAVGWDSFNGTVDYFNPCSSTSAYQVPSNAYGYQIAGNGNSYGGIIAYYNGGLSREIIGGQLISPLLISQKYYVSVMVNRGNDNVFVGYSTNKMGIKLTKTKSFSVNINNAAHYYSNVVITDTLNWVQLFGSFVADSAYQYLMVGNFFDDANTTVTNQSSGIYAYYFIDDVCLSTDSAFTYNYATSIKQNTKANKIKIYPNPASNQLLIETSPNTKIRIQNAYGIEMNFNFEINSKGYHFEVSEWENGLYFIKVDNTIQKIIINH